MVNIYTSCCESCKGAALTNIAQATFKSKQFKLKHMGTIPLRRTTEPSPYVLRDDDGVNQ